MVLSQESKQRRKKIGILTVMFLMQYFCLHVILLFSKSNYETEAPAQLQSAEEESLLTRDIT